MDILITSQNATDRITVTEDELSLKQRMIVLMKTLEVFYYTTKMICTHFIFFVITFIKNKISSFILFFIY